MTLGSLVTLAPKEDVREPSPAVETTLDLRRRRIARLIRLEMVPREWSESFESESVEELSSELEESSQLATGPGVASSSMMCCGVDSYMYEWESSWKRRYIMYTSSRIFTQNQYLD
jgi:hypothetical protein